MKRKKVILAILVGAMFVQTGCSTSKADSNAEKTGEIIEDKQLCDNVTLDDSFEIENDILKDVKVYSADEECRLLSYL